MDSRLLGGTRRYADLLCLRHPDNKLSGPPARIKAPWHLALCTRYNSIMSEGPGSPAPFSAKITIRNAGKRPRVVWVEPYPDDYTLLPDEELEIVVRDSSKVPSFDIVEYDDATQVYPDQSDIDYDVTKNGIKIESGHNRQAAIDAGIEM